MQIAAKSAESRASWGPRELHEATHFPYRSWCAACVGGRGIASPHKQTSKCTDDEGTRRPVVAMDYFFMNTKGESLATLLAMKDARSGSVFASIVPSKGATEDWVAQRAARFIERLGISEVTLKSDTEPAIISLRTDIRANSKIDVGENRGR